jgi:hypothetical protein
LESEAIDVLFKDCLSQTNYDEHILLLKEGFTGSPMQLMRFVQYLNETILSDGISDGEYALFEKVRVGLV